MAVGNKEITDLTLVPNPANTDIYCVQSGVDYRIRTGVPSGLATLGGDGKLTAAEAPDVVVPPPSYSSITDKPSTFPPSAHTHDTGDITSGVLPQARGGTGTNLATGNGPVAYANSPTLTGTPAASSITLGGGKILTKITVSNAAPVTLVDGELYLKY